MLRLLPFLMICVIVLANFSGQNAQAQRPSTTFAAAQSLKIAPEHLYAPYASITGPQTALLEAPQASPYKGHSQPMMAGSYQIPRAYPMQEPSASPAPEPPPSAIEASYNQRIVESLNQYGYDLLSGTHSPQSLREVSARYGLPAGAVQDDFILSAGDSLDVVFTGQRQDRDIYTINQQGMLILPDFPPILAAQRTIDQLRQTLQTATHSQPNTQVFISLAQARQIDILVVGHVLHPGRQTLSVFHSLLDALMEAGGITKEGSLRQIRLIRDGRTQLIDLYALFMNGAGHMDMSLRDGDRIIIPTIGPTVAISGEAKRPGIYEILSAPRGMWQKPTEQAEQVSLNQMLNFAGGVLSPGDNRFMHLSIASNGEEMLERVDDPFAPTFGDGSVLVISQGTALPVGRVTLDGHTRKPGAYPIDDYPRLSDLLSSTRVLGDDIYPLIGLIERWDEDQLTHVMLDFPLRLVLQNAYDQRLHEGDKVILLSNVQIEQIQDNDLTEKDTMPSEQGSAPDPSVIKASLNGDLNIEDILSPEVAHYLTERSIFIRGAVRRPGLYPVSAGMTLDMAIATAGGLSLEANTRNIEITSALGGEGLQSNGNSGTRRLRVNLIEESPKNIALQAGDSVRVNQRFNKIADQSVLVMGEVTNPGRYDLMPGDKISDLLTRAGGLTNQAYAPGAIFSRASARKAEESRFRAQARMMRQSIATAIDNDSRSDKDSPRISAAQITEARALAAELENVQGVGRITLEADPSVLAAQPALDMLLESGDRLFIPKRSLSVQVRGEVLSPAALQFREGKGPLEYIHEAGGFTYHADKDRTFVLYPDGSAQPLQVSHWNYNPVFIPPGSTVVVPRDPKPFDFVSSFKDVSQILSNLAVTAIFIDDVRDD